MNISNASSLSTAGNYSGIGFERTISVHFEELKNNQEFLMRKAMTLRNTYKALRILNYRWEKRKEEIRQDAVKDGVNISSWDMTDEDLDGEV